MFEHGMTWRIPVAMARSLERRGCTSERTGEFYRTSPRTAKPASVYLVSELTRYSLKLRPQGSALPTLFLGNTRPRSGIRHLPGAAALRASTPGLC